jgi:hypothetical protein
MTTKIKSQSEQSKTAFLKYHIKKCDDSSLSQVQYCWDTPLPCQFSSNGRGNSSRMCCRKTYVFYPLTVQAVQPRKHRPSSAGLTIQVNDDEVRVNITEEFSAPALKKLMTVLRKL